MTKFTKKALTLIASIIVFISLAGGSANANTTKTIKRPTPPSNVSGVNKKDQVKSKIEHLKREMKRLRNHRQILTTEYNNDRNLLNRLQNQLNK